STRSELIAFALKNLQLRSPFSYSISKRLKARVGLLLECTFIRVNMDTCFVIMPIGRGKDREKWRDIYEAVFKQSVDASGLDLRCERADDIHESGSIMKQVLMQLNSARIVLADLTTQNANVFYELGVRHALEKRSVLVGQSPDDSPFDTRQYRMLVYKHP